MWLFLNMLLFELHIFYIQFDGGGDKHTDSSDQVLKSATLVHASW